MFFYGQGTVWIIPNDRRTLLRTPGRKGCGGPGGERERAEEEEGEGGGWGPHAVLSGDIGSFRHGRRPNFLLSEIACRELLGWNSTLSAHTGYTERELYYCQRRCLVCALTEAACTQRYLAHKKRPPPQDHHGALGLGLL